MPPEQIIQRRKLSDEVRRRLLDMIGSGELPLGSAMPSERELMARYQVGRPAVREAMQSLETMQLVSSRHGERARVVPLTPRSMLAQMHQTTRHLLATSPETRQDLEAARQLFETGMVRRAAEAATEVDLDRLRSRSKRCRQRWETLPDLWLRIFVFTTSWQRCLETPFFKRSAKPCFNGSLSSTANWSAFPAMRMSPWPIIRKFTNG